MRQFNFKNEGEVVFEGDDPNCFGVHAQINIPGAENAGCFVKKMDDFCQELAQEKKRVSVEIIIKELP